MIERRLTVSLRELARATGRMAFVSGSRQAGKTTFLNLLKAANFWTDMGEGVFELFYLRSKDKAEVDFLLTRDRKPWPAAESSSRNRSRVLRSERSWGGVRSCSSS